MNCTVCGGRDANIVCHHCGRSMCTSNQCDFRVRDPAFNDQKVTSSEIMSHHCVKCLEMYHPTEYKEQIMRK